VPEAVAERALQEFDAILATEDMATAVIAVACEHNIAGLLNRSRLASDCSGYWRAVDGLRIIANPGAGTIMWRLSPRRRVASSSPTPRTK
jgi:hypothetical protein